MLIEQFKIYFTEFFTYIERDMLLIFHLNVFIIYHGHKLRSYFPLTSFVIENMYILAQNHMKMAIFSVKISNFSLNMISFSLKNDHFSNQKVVIFETGFVVRG